MKPPPAWLVLVAAGAAVTGGAAGVTRVDELAVGLGLLHIDPDHVGPQLSPARYQRGEHAVQQVTRGDGLVRFDFRFRDHLAQGWRWQWAWDEASTDEALGIYGVPAWIYAPYQVTATELARREAVIEGGLFAQVGTEVSPDHDALVGAYAGFTRPLYQLALDSLGEHGPMERAELVLRFVQDIPYGVPPRQDGDWFIAGLLPPPHVLVEAWGDCDSKSLLFSSILLHDPATEVLLLHTPNHMLAAVEAVPRPYQVHLTWMGRRYVVAEPAGPARLPLGTLGSDTARSFHGVHRLDPSAWGGTALPVGASVGGAERAGTGELEVAEVVQQGGTPVVMLRADHPVEVIASVKSGEVELAQGACLVQPAGPGRWEVRARLPVPGAYRIAVYSRPPGSQDAYSFAFEVPVQTGVGAPGSLPHTHGAFSSSGARVEAPLEGSLVLGSTAEFRLEVPGAEDVAVIVGQQWFHLDRAGVRFTGSALLDAAPVGVFARFPGDERYSGLLAYSLTDS